MGKVIFLSAEDDAADTIRPRLDAAGADVKKIYTLDAVKKKQNDGKITLRSFSLTEDIANLENLFTQLSDVRLVVIDPITAYMGDSNSHNTADVRGVLTPLADLAMRHNVAVVCVSHPNKSGGTDAKMRVTGSLAFVAAARAAFLVEEDKEQKGRRLFLPIKNNIGNDRAGLAFAIQSHTLSSGIETSKIVWEDVMIDKTASDILAEHAAFTEKKSSAVQEAIDFLNDLLGAGSLDPNEIFI